LYKNTPSSIIILDLVNLKQQCNLISCLYIFNGSNGRERE